MGVFGAIVIWSAVIAARHSARLARTLLVVGALPFAVLTWWSVVTPLAALLVLAIGLPALRVNHPYGAVTPFSPGSPREA